ncbi:MAG: HAD-IA family hydrolase [Bifidobacteriaceae bacterium]|nr:HAD-IA family hydrolase [Bifidobacteriaceae bacterium]
MVEAYLFDLDGVLTPTAAIHRRAWAQVMGGFLASRGAQPPYSEDDYFQHIDGKPRFEGVAALLASRGIDLSAGQAGEAPGEGSVAALGQRKNAEFARLLATQPVAAYPGTVEVLDALAAVGRRLAVVSSSRNALAVLRASGLLEKFALVVDGALAAAQGLPGKPAPDTYVYAAAQLGFEPAQAAVVEDAIAGLQAARAGAFGLVVGVDRGAGREALRQAGADRVISDLRQLLPAA